MKPEVVQKILGIPTYPMVAIDEDRRDEMLRILMTAASQYVGVALPDLPASELLKFTDAATEEAIAETAAKVEDEVEEEEVDEEYETIIEEVYVDEEGRVIEDVEDYEIIEEEEVEEVEEEEEEVVEEILVEAEPEPEVPVVVEIEEEPPEVEDFAVPTVAEDEEEVVEVEIEPEVIPRIPKMRVRIQKGEGPEVIIEENADAIKMAKDLIFEALEADDIIAAEIDQVSAEDIDTALEAIGSDEAIPIDGESNDTGEIDEESLMELETILGPLDRSVGGMGSVDTDGQDDDTHLPINGETIAELDRLLDVQESEETDD
jgi:hypothetical protein